MTRKYLEVLLVYLWHVPYIITGLIIDAFGELRDQLEQVKEDMEVSLCN
jgi:hypothetical protein